MTVKKPQSEAELKGEFLADPRGEDDALRYKGYLRLGETVTRRLGQLAIQDASMKESQNDTEVSMKVSDRPITGTEGQPVISGSADTPVTMADHVETASDTRVEVKESLAAGPEPIPASVPSLELQEPPEVIRQIAVLLGQNTLEAHRGAYRIMIEQGIVGSARWNDIHSNPTAAHNFSKVSRKRVNTFVKNVLRDDIMSLGPDALVMDLGCGFANDLKWMAEHSHRATFMGVDASVKAISEGKKNLEQCGLSERVILEQGDYIPDLEAWAAMERKLDRIYSHSTLHYAPALVLKHDIFPLIAKALTRQSEGTQGSGKLYLAMKLAESASAKAPNQIHLVDNDPYCTSYDMRDRIIRVYPRSKKRAINLLKPSFEIEYARVVPVRDYDRKGDTEVFAYIVAHPRAASPSEDDGGATETPIPDTPAPQMPSGDPSVF